MMSAAATKDAETWSGSYFIPDAARIARVDSRSLRRWVRGYPYRYDGKDFISPSLLQSNVLNLGKKEFLTFQQLVEVMFIGLFRNHGVSVPVIRAVSRTVAARYRTKHPFAIRQLQTDGKTIFADSVVDLIEANPADPNERLLFPWVTEDLYRAQVVIREFAQNYFQNIDYGEMEATRYWPLGRKGRVVIDPQRSFGSPIDDATGVPTNVLCGMYKAGEDTASIAKWYEVEEESVIAAIEFETSLRPAA